MRNRNKMIRQVLQSVLMLIYHVSEIINNQTYYLNALSFYDQEPDWYNSKRNYIIDDSSAFLAAACFIVAHWQFAFDYFSLSYKTKLRNDNKPVNTN